MEVGAHQPPWSTMFLALRPILVVALKKPFQDWHLESEDPSMSVWLNDPWPEVTQLVMSKYISSGS
jgi:hypothetical protein